MVANNLAKGRLALTILHASIREADVVFYYCGNPSRRGGGHTDLSYVYSVAEDIASALKSTP
jgi:UDPglucose 6-dehydrogenase